MIVREWSHWTRARRKNRLEISALLVVALLSLVTSATAWSPPNPSVSRVFLPNKSRVLLKSSDNDNNMNQEQQKLLEQARRLREQAESLEAQLNDTGKRETTKPASVPECTVQDLKDSTWTFSYRFSSQPSNDETKDGSPSKFYSGKCKILLKQDGYSELVLDPETKDNADIQLIKVWGWDEEYSQEDQQEYLLFSIDVQFPASDPYFPQQKERYYWQARIDRTPSISLTDGTITVKKDVTEKTNGRWGLFQMAGILSQFRYVGDFVAKPTAQSSN